jgi:hypothetical protein
MSSDTQPRRQTGAVLSDQLHLEFGLKTQADGDIRINQGGFRARVD